MSRDEASVVSMRATLRLPLGGRLKEDYVFIGANEHSLGKEIRFSELFGGKKTLLLYSYMFGPNWDHPCPSCTSLIDGFDRASISVTEGRPDVMTPPQNFRSEFLEKHYL